MLQKQMKWPFFLWDSLEPEKEEGDRNSVHVLKYEEENSEILNVIFVVKKTVVSTWLQWEVLKFGCQSTLFLLIPYSGAWTILKQVSYTRKYTKNFGILTMPYVHILSGCL